MEEKNDQTEEKRQKIKEKLCEVIDEFATTVRNTSVKLFDVGIEQAKETASEVFDEFKQKVKNKVMKKGCNKYEKED